MYVPNCIQISRCVVYQPTFILLMILITERFFKLTVFLINIINCNF